MTLNTLLLTLFTFTLFGTTSQAQQFQITPEYPKPGEKVHFSYDPTGGLLEGLAVSTRVFQIDFDDKEIFQAIDVALENIGGKLSASIEVPESVRGVLVSFREEAGDKVDNNDERGYKISFYEGRKPVAGANAAKAMIYYQFGRYAGIKKDNVKAFNLLKTEFKDHPVSATYPELFGVYAQLAKQQNDSAAIAFAKAKADEYANMRRPDEDKLNLAFGIYRTLGEEDATGKLKKKILKKFPGGLVALQESAETFNALESTDEKVKHYQKALKTFDINSNTRGVIDYWLSSIADAFSKDKDWDNFDYYLQKVSNVYMTANSYNNIAWDLAGGGLEQEAENLGLAEKFSKRSLELLEQEQSTLKNRPAYMSPSDWKNNLTYSYANNADTYAIILFKMDKRKDALKYQLLACETNEWANLEMNERYAIYHEAATGKPTETEALLTNFIAEGKATEAMRAQHFRLFLANNSIEQAYEKLLAQLDEKNRSRVRAELQEKMIDEPAPAFELKDLSGKTVSLAGLKGKIVIVDFWATWCGPCKASFPGMQMAVDQYKSNDDVVFLFVNTWERVDDQHKVASDFIKKNNYSFQVLLDNDNKVVESFGVQGIPTKFIIDQDGHIRFKSVGFGGDTKVLVEEMKLMIDLASNGAVKIVGAP